MQINAYVKELIQLAIKEDIGDGDHTSLACIPDNTLGKAHLLVKQAGIIAGIEVAKYIFQIIDKSIQFNPLLHDGSSVKVGDIAFSVSGSAQSILKAERLSLNIMQRMSGVATQTNIYAKELDGLKTKVLDTRKTTPGMRILDKMAVQLGGGENHRMGLFDMILIKDNHIDLAGGITKAVDASKKYLTNLGKDLDIEVETRNFDEIKEVLSLTGIRRIMLDNFSIPDTRRAVEIIDGRLEIESSGGITLENLRRYGECGVDYISVGALTHQIKSLDLSLKAIIE